MAEFVIPYALANFDMVDFRKISQSKFEELDTACANYAAIFK